MSYRKGPKLSMRCARIVRRPLAILALVAGFLGAWRGEAQQSVALEISGPTGLSEHYAGRYVVLPFERPVVSSSDGYSPTVAATEGGVLPSEWTRPVKFTWDFGDGSAPVVVNERVSVSHLYEEQGSYTLRVTAASNGAVFGGGSRQVEVRNRPPRFIRIAATPSPSENAVMHFSAWAQDTPKDTVTYHWDFGDGEQSEGEEWQVRHQYLVGGEYEVVLTARDEDGGEREKTKTILVADASFDGTTQSAPDEGGLAQTVATQFQATVSGGFSTSLDADIRSLAGVHLQAIRPGVCRFMFTAWDPRALGFGLFVLDLKNLTTDGVKYTFSNPSMVWEFYEKNEYYSVKERTMFPAGIRGIGGLVSSLTGGSDTLGSEVERRVPISSAPRTPRDLGPPAATSPFGFDETATFAWGGGSFEMTFVPGLYARGSIAGTLTTGDEDGPTGGRPISMNGDFSIDLAAARSDGFLNYEGCAGEPLEIEQRYPEDGVEHFSLRQPAIRVRFSQDIDPGTVTDSTFELGFPNNGGSLTKVEGRLLRDDETVWFVPMVPLRGGVRYTMRVKTGDEGVRSRSGSVLEDAEGGAGSEAGWESWKFTTKVDFIPEGDGGKLLACHSYQTARDVPLIVGKPAIARVYANWQKYDDVHPDAQVKDFNAKVVLRHSDESEMATTHHRFVRPDLWEARGINQASAEHTAQVTGFEPYAGMPAASSVNLQVRTIPGDDELKTIYTSLCPTVVWDKQPRLVVDTFFLKIGDIGTDPELLQTTQTVVRDLVSSARTYAWQVFPVQEIDLNVPRFVDPPDIPSWLLTCGAACWLEGAGADDSLKRWIWEGLGDWIRAQSNADIIAVLGPHEVFGGGGTTTAELDTGQGVFASSVGLVGDNFDRYVSAYVHEMGHVLGIEHIPEVDYNERARLIAERSGSAPLEFKGIEGFRMRRDGSVAWNKSSTEGNEEGAWLTPLMYPGTIHTGRAFIANHQYRRVQEFLARLGSP